MEDNVAISVLNSQGTLKNNEIKNFEPWEKKTILKISLELPKRRIFGTTGYKRYRNI